MTFLTSVPLKYLTWPSNVCKCIHFYEHTNNHAHIIACEMHYNNYTSACLSFMFVSIICGYKSISSQDKDRGDRCWGAWYLPQSIYYTGAQCLWVASVAIIPGPYPKHIFLSYVFSSWFINIIKNSQNITLHTEISAISWPFKWD